MWTKFNMWTVWTKLNFNNNVNNLQKSREMCKLDSHSLVLATGSNLLQLDLILFSFYYYATRPIATFGKMVIYLPASDNRSS